MKITATLFLFALPALMARISENEAERGLNVMKTLKLTITNLTGGQPFSPFFVMVHNSDASLFEYGEPASPELAEMAEDGALAGLVDLFDGAEGVLSVTTAEEPLRAGGTREIEVQINAMYPLVTLASMAENTNDGFVAVNGVYLGQNGVITVPGLDAGSEENDEDCGNMPGPACGGEEGAGVDEEGGFVRVHNGILGVGDLEPSVYDWKNPMMRVSAKVITA